MGFEITCPSGLRGEVRKIKQRELAMLAERARSGDGSEMTDMLSSCWVKTIDPGPYRHIEIGDIKVDFSKVARGDGGWVTYQLRAFTLGDRYPLPTMPCSACSEPNNWGVFLSGLDVVPMPEHAKKLLLDGKGFEIEGPEVPGLDDKLVRPRIQFTIPTPARNAPQREAMRRHKPTPRKLWTLADELAAQTIRVEGVGLKAQDAERKFAWYNDLDVDAIYAIRDAMDDFFPHVIERATLKCKHCGYSEVRPVPFGPNFFNPERRVEMIQSSEESTGSPSSSERCSSTEIRGQDSRSTGSTESGSGSSSSGAPGSSTEGAAQPS